MDGSWEWALLINLSIYLIIKCFEATSAALWKGRRSGPSVSDMRFPTPRSIASLSLKVCDGARTAKALIPAPDVGVVERLDVPAFPD